MQSEMKRAMSFFAHGPFSVIQQAVRDRKRQWAARRGTKAPEEAKALDQENRAVAEIDSLLPHRLGIEYLLYI